MKSTNKRRHKSQRTSGRNGEKRPMPEPDGTGDARTKRKGDIIRALKHNLDQEAMPSGTFDVCL